MWVRSPACLAISLVAPVTWSWILRMASASPFNRARIVIVTAISNCLPYEFEIDTRTGRLGKLWDGGPRLPGRRAVPHIGGVVGAHRPIPRATGPPGFCPAGGGA